MIQETGCSTAEDSDAFTGAIPRVVDEETTPMTSPEMVTKTVIGLASFSTPRRTPLTFLRQSQLPITSTVY